MISSKPNAVLPAWCPAKLFGGALLVAATIVLSGCPSSSTPTTPSSPSSSSSTPPPSSPSSGSGNPSPSSPPSGAESMPTPSSSSPGPSGSSSPTDPSSAGAPSSDTGSETADAGSESADGMETGGNPAEVVFEEGPPLPSSPSDVMPDLEDEEVEESSSATAAAESESESAGGGPSGGAPGGGAEGSGQPGGGGPVLTTAEQVAVLDGELAQGTGQFDDMILRERDYVRRTATNNTVSAEDEQETDPGGSGYPGSVYGEPGAASSNDADTGGFPGGNRQGDYGQTAAAYPPPADIPEGNDDDVVARQLREAAMREPDPELREKLWDEYRKYKGIKP